MGVVNKMAGTRYELPWLEISKDVKRAINNEMPELMFINVNRLVDQIEENAEHYPLLAGLPTQTCRGRCTRVMRNIFGWRTYSNGNGRGTVFVKGE